MIPDLKKHRVMVVLGKNFRKIKNPLNCFKNASFISSVDVFHIETHDGYDGHIEICKWSITVSYAAFYC